MSELRNKLQWPDFNFHVLYCLHDSRFGINWRHTHEDYYEMVIVRSGHATHCCEGESVRIQAGDVFLLTPGQTHHYISHGEFGIYNLLFSAGFVRRVLSGFPADPGVEALLAFDPSRRSPPRIRRPDSETLLRLISLSEEMIEAQRRPTPRSRIMITADFMKILLLAAEDTGSSGAPAPAVTGDSAFRIACLLRLLNTRFAEKWTLAKMAAVCSLSESRFRCCFKAATGMAPGTWLLRHRLYKASQMLLATELELGEIASACGFSDGNYFIRQFHRVIGVPPMKFRKNPRKTWPLTTD